MSSGNWEGGIGCGLGCHMLSCMLEMGEKCVILRINWVICVMIGSAG